MRQPHRLLPDDPLHADTEHADTEHADTEHADARRDDGVVADTGFSKTEEFMVLCLAALVGVTICMGVVFYRVISTPSYAPNHMADDVSFYDDIMMSQHREPHSLPCEQYGYDKGPVISGQIARFQDAKLILTGVINDELPMPEYCKMTITLGWLYEEELQVLRSLQPMRLRHNRPESIYDPANADLNAEFFAGTPVHCFRVDNLPRTAVIIETGEIIRHDTTKPLHYLCAADKNDAPRLDDEEAIIRRYSLEHDIGLKFAERGIAKPNLTTLETFRDAYEAGHWSLNLGDGEKAPTTGEVLDAYLPHSKIDDELIREFISSRSPS